MSVLLHTLLVGFMAKPVDMALVVSSISLDSRLVSQNGVFLALAVDPEVRSQHIKSALVRQVSAVIFDMDTPLTPADISQLAAENIPAFAVSNLQQKTSEIAARFYGHPSLALKIVAVTGTNGKTSVSQFIAQMLSQSGINCGVIGTLGAGRLGDMHATGMTTPDPVSLQKELLALAQQGVSHVIIEASSHALAQGRLNSVAVDCAVLTNLSRDHLDYHHDMADYAAAKQRLFDLDSVRHAVLNVADEFGVSLEVLLAGKSSVNVTSYSSESNADIDASQIQTYSEGLQFNIATPWGDASVKSGLLGRFNVDNLLAALASVVSLGLPFDTAISVLSACEPAAGRMQRYGNEQSPLVIVDYAHTPDALQQGLQSLRSHLPVGGKLWCVFGCGGERDQGKRPQMGAIAQTEADKIIVTDDNPRGDDSQRIIEEILSGMSDVDMREEQVVVQADRERAIKDAVLTAGRNDIVLIAGKGHEDYQEVAGQRLSFDDALVVRAALKLREAA